MTIYEKQFYETIIRELPKMSEQLKAISSELKKLKVSNKKKDKSKNKKKKNDK